MKMMAQRLYAPRDMRYEETEVPALGAHDVRIKVKCCGICGTDYSIWSGEASFWNDGLIHTPMTFGHEYSGVIDAIGSKVVKFKVGDRVVIDSAIGCGICEECLSGNYMKCKNQQSVGTVKCKDGGYAEYAVMPERHVFHLPDSVSFEEGALTEPLATAMYACKRANIKMADSVLILGTGPIGLCAIQSAKLMGAAKVVVAGRKKIKLDAAIDLGADFVIDLTKEDLAEASAKHTNGNGFDKIIEATGSHDMLRFAINHVASGGTVSAVAFYDTNVSDVNVDRIVLGDITFAGSAGNANISPIVLKQMAAGNIDATDIVTHRVNLADVGEFLENMKQNSASTIKGLIVFD